MKLWELTLIAAIFGLSCGSATALAIEGGHLVQPSDPIGHASVLLLGPNQFCTATLISTDILITAAHCVWDQHKRQPITDPKELSAYFGDAKSDSTWTQWIVFDQKLDVAALDLKYYPKFNNDFAATTSRPWPNGPKYDIAVVRINKSYPSAFSPVRILKHTTMLRHGVPVEVAGRGNPNADRGNLALRTISTNIVGNASATDSAFFVNLNLAACIHHEPGCTCLDHGDSGGPGFIRQSGQVFLWGVDSGPTNYTSVSYFYSWLKNAVVQMGGDDNF